MNVQDYKLFLDDNYAENRIVKMKFIAMLKLIEKHEPIIKGKSIIKGKDLGGIKLVYQKNYGFSLLNKTSEKIVFLKPFKENWANSKEECLKNEWGNTSSPLTNVWLRLTLNSEYNDFREAVQSIRYEIVKDPNIIASLNKYENINDSTIKKISLIEVIKFKLNDLSQIIKNKIQK